MKSRFGTGGLVYSTESGRMCPDCRQPLAQCACTLAQPRPAGDGIVRVSRETKGRGGKAVTLVKGLALDEGALAVLGKQLRAGCGSGGPVRRISEPAASLQQVSVRADGRWDVQVRLDNFSSVPMRFSAATIQVALDNGAAATVQAQPQITIGPESADVFTATVTPLAEGRARIATALADGRSLAYTLAGTARPTRSAAPAPAPAPARWACRPASAATPRCR